MKKKSFLLVGVLLMGIWKYSPVKAEETGSLRILFTSHLDGQLDSYQFTNSDGSTELRGGYARLATAIKNEKNDATIVVDAGDYSLGSYYGALNDSTAPGFALLDMVGYDVVSLGEQEYSLPALTLANVLEKKADGITVLKGNVSVEDNENAFALKESLGAIEPYVIQEVNGQRIGIFSIVDEVESEYSVEEQVAYAKGIVGSLDGVDYVICLMSGSDAKLHTLLKHVDGIDLVVSGDAMRVEPEMIGDTVVVSNGSRGSYLGEIDIQVSDKSIVNYQLVPVNDALTGDSGVSKKLEESQTVATEKLFSQYGYSTNGVVTKNPYYMKEVSSEFGTTAAGDLVSDAYAFAYETWYTQWYNAWVKDHRQRLKDAQEAAELKRAEEEQASDENETSGNEETEPTPEPIDPDVARIKAEQPYVKNYAIGIERKSSLRGNLPTGDVKMKDVYNLVLDGKAETPLVLTFISGQDLRKLAEFDASYARLKDPSSELYFSNLKYTYSDYRQDYNRVIDAEVNAVQNYFVPAEYTQLYPVVMSLDVVHLIEEMNTLTDGKLKIQYYDERGNVVRDITDNILYDGSSREYRKDIAVANYLRSMSETTQTNYVIDRVYSAPDDRKTAEKSFNLIDYLKYTSMDNLNRFKNYVVCFFAILIGYRVLRIIINRIFVK